jgi:tyrosyl-tRNA synthetase
MNDMSKVLEKVKQFDPSKVPALEAKLKKGRPLRVKYGIDPTTPHVHLGHTVPLRLMKAFQDEGHIAVLIMGDFTASIGDPTGRNELRSTSITPDEAKDNARKYLKQIGKVVDIKKAEVNLNSTWLNKCDLRWTLEQLKTFTVSQILDREDFNNRFKAEQPIQVSELMYPMLQGYDSVMVAADVELGGTEQMFNLNFGRDMQKLAGMEQQVCITLPILRGMDGVKKMGKSLGNYIGVDEEPFEMYCKVMSIPDTLMQEWVDLLTNGIDWIAPLDSKKSLALRIVESMHGTDKAAAAAVQWVNQFSLRKEPDDIPEVKVLVNDTTLMRLICAAGLTTSNNEARRLVIQGAVDLDGEKVIDPFLAIKMETGGISRRLRVGRKYAIVFQ